MFDSRSTLPVVLLVEDDGLVRMVAAEVIEAEGYRVIEAENSAEALRVLARGTVPQVLVTDVKMPGSIDGFALAHIVANRWPQVAILICSGHAQPGPGDMPAGAVFLNKPYLPMTLANKVAKLAGDAATAAG